MTDAPSRPPRRSRLWLALAVLFVLAAAGGGFLLERVHERRPRHLDLGSSEAPGTLVFSPSGERLFTGWPDAASLWDWRTGACLFSRGTPARHEVSSAFAAFSPDERELLLKLPDERASLIELPSKAERVLPAEIYPHDPSARDPIALDPTGKLLAQANGGARVVLLNLPDLTIRRVLVPREEWGLASGLTFSRPGHLVALASPGGFTIWSVATGEVVASKAGSFPFAALAPNVGGGFRIAWVEELKTGEVVLRVEDEPEGREVGRFPLGHWTANEEVSFRAALSASGEVAAASVTVVEILGDVGRVKPGVVRVFSLADGRPLATIAHGDKRCVAVALSPDDEWIATAWEGERSVTIERLPR